MVVQRENRDVALASIGTSQHTSFAHKGRRSDIGTCEYAVHACTRAHTSSAYTLIYSLTLTLSHLAVSHSLSLTLTLTLTLILELALKLISGDARVAEGEW